MGVSRSRTWVVEWRLEGSWRGVCARLGRECRGGSIDSAFEVKVVMSLRGGGGGGGHWSWSLVEWLPRARRRERDCRGAVGETI